jgi:hypothetical protein
MACEPQNRLISPWTCSVNILVLATYTGQSHFHFIDLHFHRKWLRTNNNRFCQFRLAFDVREPKQAKGALKAMSDRVAERLGVDLILPESACTP